MEKTAIKLLNIGKIEGTIRLQSQLLVGTDTADFILEDGVLKSWSHGNNGIGFYETTIPYIIVEDKKEMFKQAL